MAREQLEGKLTSTDALDLGNGVFFIIVDPIGEDVVDRAACIELVVIG